jgi:hypothetical protein
MFHYSHLLSRYFLIHPPLSLFPAFRFHMLRRHRHQQPNEYLQRQRQR